MQHFTVKPEGFKVLQKAIIIRMLVVICIVVFVVIILPEMMADSAHRNMNDNQANNNSWIYLVIMLVGVFSFSLFNSLKKQKKMLASYKLNVTDDSVIREILNTPTITILKSEVQEIVKNANGSFTVIAASKINAIGIPAQIERENELEVLLSEIKPITVKTSSWIANVQWLLAVLGGGLIFFLTFYVNNKFISAICGFIFSGLMIYSFIIIQTSKNIDRRTKRFSYFFFIPLISVISVVIIKLMSPD